jgi:hypothetical protein
LQRRVVRLIEKFRTAHSRRVAEADAMEEDGQIVEFQRHVDAKAAAGWSTTPRRCTLA